jgi:hypothetical protein
VKIILLFCIQFSVIYVTSHLTLRLSVFILILSPNLLVKYLLVRQYVAPCSLVKVYRRFGGDYCLHLHDDNLLTDFKITFQCISLPKLRKYY